ncbi:MAG: response regulator [Terracidiphilus sp.]|jgi:DNA-binding NtrC family response regulator
MAESNSGKRIFIVDDERVVADITAAILARTRFTCRPVYSAEQVLELVPDWMPDSAFIDVKLPEMNGIDLAIQLSAAYPACKLSLFSGYIATSVLLESAMQAGHSFDAIAKPVHPDVLLQLAADLSPVIGET